MIKRKQKNQNDPLSRLSKVGSTKQSFTGKEKSLAILQELNKHKRYEIDTKLRKSLAIWAAVVVSLWLITVLVILVFSKHLSDPVLITLLSTTTANTLGLMWIVLKGLFKAESAAV